MDGFWGLATGPAFQGFYARRGSSQYSAPSPTKKTKSKNITNKHTNTNKQVSASQNTGETQSFNACLNCFASDCLCFFCWVWEVFFKVLRRLKINCIVVRRNCKHVFEGDSKPDAPGMEEAGGPISTIRGPPPIMGVVCRRSSKAVNIGERQNTCHSKYSSCSLWVRFPQGAILAHRMCLEA